MGGVMWDMIPAGLVPWSTALSALLLSFALGLVLAMTYVQTFRGLSYSRGLVQGLALGPLVTCMLMLGVGQSIAASIGLAGGLSIIRFRTTMRDPRDMMFIFAALGAGLVVGLRAWAVGVAGITLFCLAVVVLSWIEFGASRQYDALVRFMVATDRSEAATAALHSSTLGATLVSLREGGPEGRMEYAFQVVLADPDNPGAVALALEAVESVSDVGVFPQAPQVDP